jgi:hypothetical protein
MTAIPLNEALQLAGWLLTVLGQVQIALRQRRGFVTGIGANAVLVALCAHVGLWWSIDMYLTNVAVCLWSYRRWAAEDTPMRALFVKRALR